MISPPGCRYFLIEIFTLRRMERSDSIQTPFEITDVRRKGGEDMERALKFTLMAGLSLALGLCGTWGLPAQAGEIIHDAEYYIL